jgi:UDP-2,3-diacylglucosamine pyrophosphatase LpxH
VEHKIDMRKLFISDIHLGSPLFKHRENLVRLLKNNNFDQLFLLGDIIDTWEGSVYAVETTYADIIHEINRRESSVVIVRGNHDPPISHMRFIFPKAKIHNFFTLRLPDGRKCALVHGEEFDDQWFKYSYLARTFFGLQWMFERFGMNFKPFFSTIKCSLSKNYKRRYWNELVSAIETKAVSIYKEGYDCLVMGHTHVGKVLHLIEHDNMFTYVNCGSLEKRRPTFAEYSNYKFKIRNLKEY